MYKRFLNKIIREDKYPRCHYTRKRNKWKPKVPYNSENIAYMFIKERHLQNYDVYRCPICGKWHIGYHKDRVEIKPSF